METNKQIFGQYFTSDAIVNKMLLLKQNNGKTLEPSCGTGAFSNKLANCVSIEIDPTIAPKNALIMDFFDFPITEKFDTIIGNPPYVVYKNIAESTKSKLDLTLFDERTNLYLFFIEKCIKHLNDHGELIFIVPRSFLKATSAIKLNEFIYNSGTITYLEDLGDARIFDDADPNCIIFRFEKGNFSRQVNINRRFCLNCGQLLFLSNNYSIPFNKLFFVKVGAVSGADQYFINENGNQDFVCSTTKTDKKLRRMYYNVDAPYLKQYETQLMQRKLKKFNEENYYMWGRDYYKSNKPRIYVNQKTRVKHPFFTNECTAYDGSILAIFLKFKIKKRNIKKVIKKLNRVNWNELGFMCGNRYIFSQKALENALLPKSLFKNYLKKVPNDRSK